MKIQLKRSNVLDGSAAKKPSAEQMEYGELAVNYNNGDPAVFLKDSNDTVIRIAGKGATGLDGDYVNITGDNMTGDLTLGTNNITLDASGGSITAAGDVQIGGNQNGQIYLGSNSAGQRCNLTFDGTGAEFFDIGIKGSQAQYGHIRFNTGTTPTERLRIDSAGDITATGSITAAGKVVVGYDPLVVFDDNGIQLAKVGAVHVRRFSDPANPVFAGYSTVSGSTPTSMIASDGSATFAGSITAGSAVETSSSTYSNVGNDGHLVLQNNKGDAAQRVFSVYDGLYSSAGAIKIQFFGDGSGVFKGDVSIGDSATFFNLISDVVAALPEEITEEFASVIATWNQASAYTDVSTLPADIPTPLKDAVVRATTAGKINLNSDGSASFAGGAFKIESDGDISTNIRGQGHIELDSTGSFTNPKIKLFSNTGNATFAGKVIAGGDPDAGSSVGANLNHQGLLQVTRTGTNQLFQGFTQGSSTPTSTITAAGSATFAGEVLVGTRARFNTDGARDNAQSVIDIYDQDGQGVNPSTVRINADGSAEFAETITSGSTTSRGQYRGTCPSSVTASDATFLDAQYNGTSAAFITYDGAATFKGTVTANGYSMASLAQL